MLLRTLLSSQLWRMHGNGERASDLLSVDKDHERVVAGNGGRPLYDPHTGMCLKTRVSINCMVSLCHAHLHNGARTAASDGKMARGPENLGSIFEVEGAQMPF